MTTECLILLISKLIIILQYTFWHMPFSLYPTLIIVVLTERTEHLSSANPITPVQRAGGHGQQNSNFSPKQQDEIFLGGYVSLCLPSLKIGK